MAELKDLIRKSRTKFLRDLVTQKSLATLHVIIEQRIFRDGIDARGKLIGIYSEAYQKTRRRNNYPISRKVILQATRQMVNDFSFLVLPGNKYGSGFKNSFNFDKSEWVENTYKKEIFALTRSEDKKLSFILEKNMRRVFQ